MEVKMIKVERTREDGDYYTDGITSGLLDGVRDDVIVGEADPPEVGKPFMLVAKGRDVEGAVRVVNTSTIKEIVELDGDAWSIITHSGSTYLIEKMEES